MEKTIYVLIAVFVTALVFGAYQVGRFDSQDDFSLDNMQSQVEKLLGSTPSEDMRHLLQQPLPDPYFPEEGIFLENQYVIYLEGMQDLDRMVGIFYEDLPYYCSVYFQSNGEWQLIEEAEDETKADQWMVLFDLLDYDEEETRQPLTLQDLKEINAAVESYAKRLKLTVKYSETVDEAVKRAADYDTLLNTYGKTIQLVLKADEQEPYRGQDIHDVALALGMELSYQGYQWSVVDPGRLYDAHFTVADPDTYLTPEKLAHAKYAARSLTFSFYLPYSIAPADVYDNMLTAIQYFQKRLGGTIQDEAGHVMTAETLEKQKLEMLEWVKELEEQGYKPGYYRAYMMF